MKTKCLLALVFLCTGATFSARADQSLSNLVIKRVAPGEGGIFITFTTLPSACTGAYRTAHGYVPSTAANFDALYTLATSVIATSQPVEVTFTDRGNCQNAATTMFITDIK